jgi:very-short-patch-repair endonuclease
MNIFDDKVMARLDNYVRDQASDLLFSTLANVGRACESPIELLMLGALYAVSKIPWRWDLSIIPAESFRAQTPFDASITLACQVVINEYRVDFAMWIPAEPQYGLIVECDGHEFHERTKEQAERDKFRDRALQAKGFKVFRFTGREIWRDPFKCATEVLRMAENDIVESLRDEDGHL